MPNHLYDAAKDAMLHNLLDGAEGIVVYEERLCWHNALTRWWDRVFRGGHDDAHGVPVTYLRVGLDAGDDKRTFTISISPSGILTIDDE